MEWMWDIYLKVHVRIISREFEANSCSRLFCMNVEDTKHNQAYLEELHEVVELAMNVSTDSDGGLELNHGLLASQQSSSLVDDLQGCVLIHPSLEYEVLLQHLRLWLVCPRVEDFAHTQLI